MGLQHALCGTHCLVCLTCRGIIRRDSFWDRLVFGKIQALLGGRVRYLVTGSAPIPKEVLRFMRISLGCQVFEGYGQTEAHAASCLTIPGETSAGHVGPPLPCVMIKLVDVPEMNYFSANNEGEVGVLRERQVYIYGWEDCLMLAFLCQICFKGPSVFKGYLKNDEKTREALDEQGWLHSGDIGKWLPQGVLKIIDRKKQIFKTQQVGGVIRAGLGLPPLRRLDMCGQLTVPLCCRESTLLLRR